MLGTTLAQARALVGHHPHRRGGAASTAARLQLLCAGAVRALPVSGGAACLLDADGGLRGEVVASGSPGADALAQQLGGRGGPVVDAVGTARTVVEGDLAGRGRARWPLWAPFALAVGVAAVCAVPLRLGAAVVGALELYGDRPGALAGRHLALALAAGEVGVEIVLEDPSGAGGTVRGGPVDAEVSQAHGMVTVQCAVTPVQAATLLLVYARSADRSLADVARDIVGRRLRLDPLGRAAAPLTVPGARPTQHREDSP